MTLVKALTPATSSLNEMRLRFHEWLAQAPEFKNRHYRGPSPQSDVYEDDLREPDYHLVEGICRTSTFWCL